jgi:hypothetical protein
VWGTHTVNFAIGVEYDENNDWIVALTYGREDSAGTIGPHLLYYTLDGERLFETDYPELPGQNSIDLCRAPDGGFTFLTQWDSSYGRLSHTDPLGDLLWIDTSGLDGEALGLDRTTLDNGYLLSGWTGASLGEETDSIGSVTTDEDLDPRGKIHRWAGYGDWLWEVSEFNRIYYCTIQLPQGGYMAAGGVYQGGAYLARYAPETGIEESPDGPDNAGLSAHPNPFVSSCSVSFEVSQACDARLELYDLSGRLIDSLMDGHVGAGSHEARIEGSGLSPGVYLLRLRAGDRSMVRRVVLVR